MVHSLTPCAAAVPGHRWLLGPSSTSNQNHLVTCLGMEGWANAITASLSGAPHSPWFSSGKWSDMCRKPSFAVHIFLILSVPCHAVPCHAVLGATASRQRGVTGCLAEGARPCSCGRGPSLCMGTGHAVLLRSSSARGMIDLVSASGGLSQCQASA